MIMNKFDFTLVGKPEDVGMKTRLTSRFFFVLQKSSGKEGTLDEDYKQMIWNAPNKAGNIES